MEDRVEELYSYIQGHCLWQFFAREWDRKANIEGIIGKTIELLTESEHSVSEAPIDKYFYVEAKILSSDIKNKFPWLNGLDEGQIKAIMKQVKERLIEILIVKSRNPELRISSY